MSSPDLRQLARELLDALRKNSSIDSFGSIKHQSFKVWSGQGETIQVSGLFWETSFQSGLLFWEMSSQSLDGTIIMRV